MRKGTSNESKNVEIKKDKLTIRGNAPGIHVQPQGRCRGSGGGGSMSMHLLLLVMMIMLMVLVAAAVVLLLRRGR